MAPVPPQILLVQQCESVIGYQFADKDLCWEALQCIGSGVSWAGHRHCPDGNRRLAIVGNAAINLIMSAHQWYPTLGGGGELIPCVCSGRWTDSLSRSLGASTAKCRAQYQSWCCWSEVWSVYYSVPESYESAGAVAENACYRS